MVKPAATMASLTDPEMAFGRTDAICDEIEDCHTFMAAMCKNICADRIAASKLQVQLPDACAATSNTLLSTLGNVVTYFAPHACDSPCDAMVCRSEPVEPQLTLSPTTTYNSIATSLVATPSPREGLAENSYDEWLHAIAPQAEASALPLPGATVVPMQHGHIAAKHLYHTITGIPHFAEPLKLSGLPALLLCALTVSLVLIFSIKWTVASIRNAVLTEDETVGREVLNHHEPKEKDLQAEGRNAEPELEERESFVVTDDEITLAAQQIEIAAWTCLSDVLTAKVNADAETITTLNSEAARKDEGHTEQVATLKKQADDDRKDFEERTTSLQRASDEKDAEGAQQKSEQEAKFAEERKAYENKLSSNEQEINELKEAAADQAKNREWETEQGTKRLTRVVNMLSEVQSDCDGNKFMLMEATGTLDRIDEAHGLTLNRKNDEIEELKNRLDGTQERVTDLATKLTEQATAFEVGMSSIKVEVESEYDQQLINMAEAHSAALGEAKEQAKQEAQDLNAKLASSRLEVAALMTNLAARQQDDENSTSDSKQAAETKDAEYAQKLDQMVNAHNAALQGATQQSQQLEMEKNTLTSELDATQGLLQLAQQDSAGKDHLMEQCNDRANQLESQLDAALSQVEKCKQTLFDGSNEEESVDEQDLVAACVGLVTTEQFLRNEVARLGGLLDNCACGAANHVAGSPGDDDDHDEDDDDENDDDDGDGFGRDESEGTACRGQHEGEQVEDGNGKDAINNPAETQAESYCRDEPVEPDESYSDEDVDIIGADAPPSSLGDRKMAACKPKRQVAQSGLSSTQEPQEPSKENNGGEEAHEGNDQDTASLDLSVHPFQAFLDGKRAQGPKGSDAESEHGESEENEDDNDEEDDDDEADDDQVEDGEEEVDEADYCDADADDHDGSDGAGDPLSNQEPKEPGRSTHPSPDEPSAGVASDGLASDLPAPDSSPEQPIPQNGLAQPPPDDVTLQGGDLAEDDDSSPSHPAPEAGLGGFCKAYMYLGLRRCPNGSKCLYRHQGEETLWVPPTPQPPSVAQASPRQSSQLNSSPQLPADDAATPTGSDGMVEEAPPATNGLCSAFMAGGGVCPLDARCPNKHPGGKRPQDLASIVGAPSSPHQPSPHNVFTPDRDTSSGQRETKSKATYRSGKAARERPRDPSVRATMTCRFWASGNCRKGDSCQYKHAYSDPSWK